MNAILSGRFLASVLLTLGSLVGTQALAQSNSSNSSNADSGNRGFAAKTAIESAPAASDPASSESKPWLADVQKVGQAFAQAYEAGDAKAIAACFLEKGEFVDSERTIYEGRAAIEEEFAAFFETTEKQTISSRIDLVREVTPGLVIEDGVATIVRNGGEARAISRYSVVYAKVGEQWQMASLRDISSEYAEPGDHLQALNWLIGDWIDESTDGIVERTFYWSEDGNYILGEYGLIVAGNLEASGNIRIGWDPATKQFRTWLFDAEGGIVNGSWSQTEDGWRVKMSGTRSDGVAGSATNYYQPQGEDRLVWRSVERVIGIESLPDVEVTLARKPPAPKKEDPVEARPGGKDTNADKK